MSQICEFHFQEGFTGQSVSLAVDGEQRLSFEAKTRSQVGIARIEMLDLDPGQTVVIEVPELALHEKYSVVGDERWISVNLRDRSLVVRSLQSAPGYL